MLDDEVNINKLKQPIHYLVCAALVFAAENAEHENVGLHFLRDLCDRVTRALPVADLANDHLAVAASRLRAWLQETGMKKGRVAQ